MRSFALLLSSALLMSCSMLTMSDTSDNIYTERFMTADESVSVVGSQVRELSGLVHSRLNPGKFWAHNDSGGQARIFLINPKSGQIEMQVTMAGFRNYDFEDITLRTIDGVPYVVVGDIGDNAGTRKRIALYQFPEPKYEGTQNTIMPQDKIQTMYATYAEGARDAETLMTTPDGNLMIITKREAENYIYSFAFEPDTQPELTAIGKLAINNLTAGDINDQGEIAIRNYAQIFYWPPSENPVTYRLLNEPPLGIPTAPEPQGEALAWDGKGGLVSIPEKPFMFDQVIFYYAPKVMTEKTALVH